jgi:hypothetical protein
VQKRVLVFAKTCRPTPPGSHPARPNLPRQRSPTQPRCLEPIGTAHVARVRGACPKLHHHRLQQPALLLVITSVIVSSCPTRARWHLARCGGCQTPRLSRLSTSDHAGAGARVRERAAVRRRRRGEGKDGGVPA